MTIDPFPAATAMTDRRTFLQTATAGAMAAFGVQNVRRTAPAAEPPRRTGKPSMKLSLAGYSFNRHLPRRPTAEELKNAEMTLDDFIDFCAELNLDGCEPTAYYFPRNLTRNYLLHVKQKTFRLGLDISGTAIGNDFAFPDGPKRDAQLQVTREWIDHAATIGAPVIRIFAGRVHGGDDEKTAVERCIAGINESLDYAARKGVFLALENHGGITATAEQMLRIVDGVKDSPWFGVNFDSGNFRTEDPYRDLERIAPYAVNAQIKVAIAPNGKKQPADLERIVGILKDAGYRGYIVLEYEESDPWNEIPRYIDRLRELTSA